MPTPTDATKLVPKIADSALALAAVRLAKDSFTIDEPESDSLLYVISGGGSLALGGENAELRQGGAALILAAERATVSAGSAGLAFLQATVGPAADRHAPLGSRAVVVRTDDESSAQATGARSFRVLFGPHNGSTRATLFVGHVPPGRAPWHYHLYDEIVWTPDGHARLHRPGSEDAVAAGSAFRLRPRDMHIVENASSDRDLTVFGVFTPAGSPSAAYLAPER